MAQQEDRTEQIERAGELSIIEFLEARIAEDEAQAEAADDSRWTAEDKGITFELYSEDYDGGDAQARLVADTSANMNHIADWAPRRVLAECAAKRAIIEDWEDPNGDGVWEGYDYGCALTTDRAARALAAVYADHPDYQQEWARG